MRRVALTMTCALGTLVCGCLPPAQIGDQDAGMAEMAPVHVEEPPVGDPDPPPPPADLAGSVQVDMFVSSGTATVTLGESTAALRLNEKKDIVVTVSGNGTTGTGTLALRNPPTGMTATFNPPTVTLAGSPVMATMTVTATSNMDPATSVAASVEVTVGGAASSTTFGVTVMPELLVTIAPGVQTTNNPTAFGATSIPVKLIGTGTKITFVNNDGIAHRIHADGSGGLDHEANNMAPNGGTYTDTLTAKGTINFFCHIHSGMKGQLVVQ